MKGNIPYNMLHKELKISSITNFHKFFNYLESILIYQDAFSKESRMLMRQNVNNDASKDHPMRQNILPPGKTVIIFVM